MAHLATEIIEADTPDRLRHALVDRLCDQRLVRAVRVEAALRAVPRHLFVPAASLREAYADDIVRTKHDPDGVTMLGRLAAEHRRQ